MARNRYLQPRVLLGFAIALALLAADGIVSLRSIRLYSEFHLQQAETFTLLNTLAETVSTVTTAETSVRAYLLTGDDTRLETYREAVGGLPALLRALETSANAHAPQTAHLRRLKELVSRRMVLAGELADIYRARGAEAARAHMRLGAGARAMEELRAEARAAALRERQQLLEISDRATAAGLLAGRTILLGNLIALLLLGFAGFRIRRDMRERERSEALVAQSEERLKAVLDGAQQTAVIATDTRGTITLFNRGAERMLGYTAEELVGKNTPSIMHLASEIAEHGEELSRRCGRTIAGFDVFVEEARQGHYQEREWTYVRKNGGRLIVSLAVTALRDGAGAISGFLGIAVDVTERRHAEAELRKLSLAVEQSPVCIVITDLKGDIEYVNPKFVELTGYSLAEVLGKNPRVLKSGETQPEAYKELWEAITAGKAWRGEFHNKKKNGELYWEYASISPVKNAKGETTHFIAVKEDITERKKAAEELARARDAALAAARTKAAFLSNMSHEIRTPLNAVIGMTELLLDTELTPPQRESAQIIRNAGDSLLALINDILDFSKIESGRMTLERVEFDLRQEVTGGAALLSVKARTKGIGLETSVAPEVPALVSGDPAKFRQVLVNLIGNAVKFTEQGKISVRASWDPAGAGAVLTEVADTGIGMAPEVLPRLFTAFTQADVSTTRRFGGSGLGLAICRQLVELMGGEIGAESTAGRGSRFWFRLPLGRAVPPAVSPVRSAAPEAGPAAPSAASAPAARPAAASPKPASACRGRILVAEDNEVNQKLIGMQLQKLGHVFDIVGNGKEALLAAEKTPYRMVLMDCQMPVLDGYEATGRIRESEGGQGRIPVVAITAEGFEADRQRCLDAGMDDFLSKPFKVAALETLIERWSSPVDRATLDGLREFIGVADTAAYRDFLAVFLTDARKRLELVRGAAAAGDAKALADEAHSLKGSAGTIGARYLQGLCRRLESLGRAGAAAQAGPWLEAAAVEFSALSAALEAELARSA